MAIPILNFPRSGVPIGGGGSSGAPGIGTIWGPVANWAALATIPSAGLRVGDRAAVADLGAGTGSSGIAQWSGTQWRLDEGLFDTFASMTGFAQPVRTGAFAAVNAGAAPTDTAVTYLYATGTWNRFGEATLGFSWVLSGLRDFTPSGALGNLKEGDYGFFGERMYRYAAAVPIAAGGTTPMWLPPNVYAGTLSIRGIVVGTEPAPALPFSTGGVNFSLLSGTGATVTQASDYFQMRVTAPNMGQLLATCPFSQTSGTRSYVQVEMSFTAVSVYSVSRIMHSSEGNALGGWYFSPGQGTQPSFVDVNLNLQGSSLALRSGGIAMPTNASGNYDWMEWVDEGRNVAVECIRNGIGYARSQRSTSTPGAPNPVAGISIWMSGGTGPASSHTLRFRQWRTLSW